MSHTIVSTLIYVFSTEGSVLLQQRKGRSHDFGQSIYNGLGGKLLPAESPRDGAARELYEESGLKISPERFLPAGLLYFPALKPDQNWMSWVWTVRGVSPDQELIPNEEGALVWVPQEKLLAPEYLDSMWAADRVFLPVLLASKMFWGSFWYDGPRLIRHEFFVP